MLGAERSCARHQVIWAGHLYRAVPGASPSPAAAGSRRPVRRVSGSPDSSLAGLDFRQDYCLSRLTVRGTAIEVSAPSAATAAALGLYGPLSLSLDQFAGCISRLLSVHRQPRPRKQLFRDVGPVVPTALAQAELGQPSCNPPGLSLLPDRDRGTQPISRSSIR